MQRNGYAWMRGMASSAVVACAAATAFAIDASAQAVKSPAAQVRSIAKELRDANGIPGISIAVGDKGQIVFSEGFGYSDYEHRLPVTPLTRMRIGSVSKSVTSIALGQLMESGRLDASAEIQTYVSAFPRKRWPITVRQVAGHTAGIRHYRGQENLISRNYPTVTEALTIFENDSLLFEPGSRYLYSSYGWNLLSAVVEGASGMLFTDYMRTRVFQPLGLRSIIPEYVDSIITFRSRFYERGADNVIRNAPFVNNSYKWAGGGFISNTEDLVTLSFSLLHGDILKPATVQALFAPQKLNSGEPTTYGMGWFSGTDDKGRKMVWHTGGSVGGRAVLLLYPDQDLVVAMLANAGHAPMSVANARRVAEAFMTNNSR